MSSASYTKFIKSVDTVYETAESRKVIFLENKTDNWNGKQLHINGAEMVNFGTCGYLGLETDRRLIDKSIDYVNRFGTQFSVSRTFLISKLVRELEEELSRMFDGANTLVFSSTTLTHISVLPAVVHHKDAVILDKQVHFSVQSAAQLLQTKGISLSVIKHNDMTMLDRVINSIKDKHQKVWYMIDGVYSMFGDFTPVEELNAMMAKYEQLHLYLDDAHGVGWAGKNGTGIAYDDLIYKDRIILSTTMAKGFGSTGGMVVFPKKSDYDKVYKFGGPLSYSHPLAPSIIGASTASAQIMNSPEINVIQKELADRIKYCNSLLEATNLPMLSDAASPIKFVGVGDLETGYRLHSKIQGAGFYNNVALFPAVRMDNTGMRFTITRHVTMEQIKDYVDTLSSFYWETLEEVSTTLSEVRAAFNLPEVVV